MLSIYTFVFTYVLKSKFGIQIEEDHKGAFAIIMFCGMSVFNIFSEVLNNCTTVITSNQSFVKKVIFPLEILPISQVLTSLIFGIIWFFLLFIGSSFILKDSIYNNAPLTFCIDTLSITIVWMWIFCCFTRCIYKRYAIYNKCNSTDVIFHDTYLLSDISNSRKISYCSLFKPAFRDS